MPSPAPLLGCLDLSAWIAPPNVTLPIHNATSNRTENVTIPGEGNGLFLLNPCFEDTVLEISLVALLLVLLLAAAESWARRKVPAGGGAGGPLQDRGRWSPMYVNCSTRHINIFLTAALLGMSTYLFALDLDTASETPGTGPLPNGTGVGNGTLNPRYIANGDGTDGTLRSLMVNDLVQMIGWLVLSLRLLFQITFKSCRVEPGLVGGEYAQALPLAVGAWLLVKSATETLRVRNDVVILAGIARCQADPDGCLVADDLQGVSAAAVRVARAAVTLFLAYCAATQRSAPKSSFDPDHVVTDGAGGTGGAGGVGGEGEEEADVAQGSKGSKGSKGGYAALPTTDHGGDERAGEGEGDAILGHVLTNGAGPTMVGGSLGGGGEAKDEAKDDTNDTDDAPPPPPSALVRSTTQSYDQFEGRCSSERGASLWSFISFSWMNDLIEVGHMTPLSMDHIYLLETSDLPSTNARALQDAWDKMGRHRSLARAVHAVFWKPLWLAGVLQAVVVGTTLMTPAVLNKLLSYVQNPILAQADTGAWNGYVFGACLVLLMLFQQIAQTQYVVLCVCACVCVCSCRSSDPRCD